MAQVGLLRRLVRDVVLGFVDAVPPRVIEPALPATDPELSRQLDRVSSARSAEVSICWTVFSIFGAAQAVLVAAWYTRNDNGYASAAALAVIGVLTCLVWFLSVHRSWQHIARYERSLFSLETALGISDDHRISYIRLPGIKARITIRACPVAAAIGWLLALWLTR